MLLHPGFPKTGTTSFQHMLANDAGGKHYLGKYRNAGIESMRARKEVALTNFFRYETGVYRTRSSSILSKSNLEYNLARGFLATSRFGGNWKNMVYSDEDLCWPGPVSEAGSLFGSLDMRSIPDLWFRELSDFPLYRFLRSKSGDMVTSVMFTIRRQWEIFPSLYAERSKDNPRASQEDFEFQTVVALDKLPWLFDYQRWVQEVNESSPKLRTVALRLEDPKAWSSLLTEFPSKGAHLNKKSTNQNCWQLNSRHEGVVIRLPDWLKSQIKNHFHSSNMKLFESQGWEEGLGYL